MFALAEQVRRHQRKRTRRVAYHSSAIASVIRQDRKRGRSRRRLNRTVPPAGHKDQELALGRLDKDDLGFPLILLGEAAALLNGSSAPSILHLALKAKLTCAGALLARGRRLTTARRVAEMVRQAIVLIGDGPSDGDGRREKIRHKVKEGRGLLRSYLGHKQKGGDIPPFESDPLDH